MLTISQLAAYAGVTVRTVRHYHQRGLLAEPERDHSGYRRYDGEHVVSLIRIKTLANAGVPLARVAELLDAGPEAFAAAVTEIDRDLRDRIRQLQQHRRDLAQLPSAERLSVPDGVADLLDGLRELGISERTLTMEREGWILLAAAFPTLVPGSVAWKLESLRDPFWRRLILRYEEAFDWDPDDPRILPLAEDSLVAMERHYPVDDAEREADLVNANAAAYRLVADHNIDASAAWRRLNDLVDQLARERGYPVP